jgi:hypothetical protein
MAQDQTIEIKVSLRDEISKAAEQAVAKLLRLNQVDTSRSQTAFNKLGQAASFAGREIRSLATITGVGGILGAGGIVAGLVAAKRSLDDFAQSGMRMHFTARELRVSEGFLRDYTDAMRAVGQSEGEAASGIQSALRTLEEAWTEGKGSRMFKELEKDVTGAGTKLFQEVMRTFGKEGPDKALELALTRMEGMNPRAQAAFSKIMGFGTVGATELRKILPQLVPVIRMSKDEMLKYNIANVNLDRTWGSIKTTIGNALLPAFTELTKAVDQYLRSPAGQKFLADIKGWITSMAESMRGPGFANQLKAIVEGTEKVVTDLGSAFKVADDTVKAMGATWPGIFETLIAGGILAWLGRVAFAFAGLAKFRGLIGLLLRISPAVLLAMLARWARPESADEAQRKIEEENRKRVLEQPGLTDEQKENLKTIPWLRGGKKSGALAPAGEEKGTIEKLAEAAAVRLTSVDLKEKLGTLDDELSELTGHLMIGGPGEGYQFGGGAGEPAQSAAPERPAPAPSSQWQETPLPAGSFSQRARIEKWGALKSFLRGQRQEGLDALSRSGFAEWQNAPSPPGYGPGGNLPRAGGIQQYLRDYDPGSAPDWLVDDKTLPFERRTGLTAGGGGGGTLVGKDLGVAGDAGARARITPWTAPTIPQLSPMIAPRLRASSWPQGPGLPLGGVAGELGGGMDGFDMPLPGWESQRLNRNIARAEGFKGSGQVDIDIGNVAASPDASAPTGLFRPLILEKTPQMAAAGIDRSVPSNFNQA